MKKVFALATVAVLAVTPAVSANEAVKPLEPTASTAGLLLAQLLTLGAITVGLAVASQDDATGNTQ